MFVFVQLDIPVLIVRSIRVALRHVKTMVFAPMLVQVMYVIVHQATRGLTVRRLLAPVSPALIQAPAQLREALSPVHAQQASFNQFAEPQFAMVNVRQTVSAQSCQKQIMHVPVTQVILAMIANSGHAIQSHVSMEA
jgi:hypothetical protein